MSRRRRATAPPTSAPPAELTSRLESILPPERLTALLDPERARRRLTIRINTLRSTPEAVLEDLTGSSIITTPVAWCDHAFHVDVDARALQETTTWKSGHFHIQSLSSIATSLMLEPAPGERILDMCAAPGSKTSHIAALMGNEGELVANDLSKARMHRMRAILEQLGAQARTRVGPGEQIGRRDPDSFDRVLLDAPCSGEGRITPNDPTSWSNWRRTLPRRLGSRQKSLLHSAIDAVRPGGVIVYSTCTFAPEENELVLQRALERYGDRVALESLPVSIPDALPPLSEWNGRKLPDLGMASRLAPPSMDGFFIARLRRTD